jgi:hypothetical protein
MYFVYMYEDRTLTPVKIILNWQEWGTRVKDDGDESNQGIL